MEENAYVQVCNSFSEAGECLTRVWRSAYLPSSDQDFSLLYDFNPEQFWVGFGSTITLFAIGLGVGSVLGVLRKAR